MDTALTPYRAGHADVGRGIALAYETYGAPEQPAIVLIMGLGMQLTAWPQALVRHLVDAGFHVVRFDNRDAGMSTQLGSIAPTWWAHRWAAWWRNSSPAALRRAWPRSPC